MSSCVVCKDNVSARQHALECDACHEWVHRKCQKGMLNYFNHRKNDKPYYQLNVQNSQMCDIEQNFAQQFLANVAVCNRPSVTVRLLSD